MGVESKGKMISDFTTVVLRTTVGRSPNHTIQFCLAAFYRYLFMDEEIVTENSRTKTAE